MLQIIASFGPYLRFVLRAYLYAAPQDSVKTHLIAGDALPRVSSFRGSQRIILVWAVSSGAPAKRHPLQMPPGHLYP
ncbi:MAG: hypothetical protein ACOX0U_05270 [Oscillospiraceae bacterium]